MLLPILIWGVIAPCTVLVLVYLVVDTVVCAMQPPIDERWKTIDDDE